MTTLFIMYNAQGMLLDSLHSPLLSFKEPDKLCKICINWIDTGILEKEFEIHRD